MTFFGYQIYQMLPAIDQGLCAPKQFFVDDLRLKKFIGGLSNFFHKGIELV